MLHVVAYMDDTIYSFVRRRIHVACKLCEEEDTCCM